MKYLAALAATLSLASPAFAHAGPHLHPHGAGEWLTVSIFLAIVAAGGGLVYYRARNRK